METNKKEEPNWSEIIGDNDGINYPHWTTELLWFVVCLGILALEIYLFSLIF